MSTRTHRALQGANVLPAVPCGAPTIGGMVPFIVAATVLTGTAAVLVALVLVARRLRRRGSAGAAIGAAMAAYDEAMHPLGYEAAVEVRAQDDRAASVTAAGDR
jgi:hypothetical protein